MYKILMLEMSELNLRWNVKQQKHQISMTVPVQEGLSVHQLLFN